MPSIRIQGTELSYDDSNLITFEEGLIGMPQLKYMVLIEQADITPFLWLASVDDPRVAFLVVDPRLVFTNYDPDMTIEMRERLAAHADAGTPPTPLAIVKISSEWKKTTVNLRAPLFVSADSMRGAQVALSDTAYKLEEPLPVASAA